MEQQFYNNKKKFKIKVHKCNAFQKVIGLMFKKKQNAKALLFEFDSSNQSIHSYFVFFPFVAVWLDKNNKVIELKKVKPFKLSINPKKPFSKLIEIPINKRYSTILSNLYKT
jgi:uncharacterized membrane protein (UPF0127 family)